MPATGWASSRKNALVTRDLDLLRELAAHNAVRVYISITSLDAQLARVMERRPSSPRPACGQSEN